MWNRKLEKDDFFIIEFHSHPRICFTEVKFFFVTDQVWLNEHVAGWKCNSFSAFVVHHRSSVSIPHETCVRTLPCLSLRHLLGNSHSSGGWPFLLTTLHSTSLFFVWYLCKFALNHVCGFWQWEDCQSFDAHCTDVFFNEKKGFCHQWINVVIRIRTKGPWTDRT